MKKLSNCLKITVFFDSLILEICNDSYTVEDFFYSRISVVNTACNTLLYHAGLYF